MPSFSSSKQRCPKCGFSNEPNATSCAHCQAPLVIVCPRCGTARRWYLPTCPNCAVRAEDEEDFIRLFKDTPRGQLNNRYTIREVMSQSAVSALYRCQDSKQPEQLVAVKELQASALFRPQERRAAEQAFWAQVKRWQTADHPALTPIWEAFTERERYYVVMPYLTGLSWQVLVADNRWQVTFALAANWLGQLCHLLLYLGALDEPLHLPFLAPQHIMVTINGQIKVLDYGLTALFAPGQYGPYGSIDGYAAPELQQTPPDSASDIYSLGRMIYALLTHQQLEQGGKTTIPLHQAVPGITEGFARVISRAAQRQVAKRYTTADELAQALQAAGFPVKDALPTADWIVQAMRPQRPASQSSQAPRGATPSHAESMEELGFMPDPRFGQRASRILSTTEPAENRDVLDSTAVREPWLSISPKTIVIAKAAATPKRVVVTLRNRGGASIAGRMRSNLAYVRAPAKPFVLSPGQTARAILAIDTTKLPAGEHNEAQAVAVETDAGRSWISLHSQISSAPMLSIAEPLLDFGVIDSDTPQSLPLVIGNSGSTPMSGKVASSVPWLAVQKPIFRCGAHATTQVTVRLLPDKLPAGQQQATAALLVDSDGGQAQIEARAWRRRPVISCISWLDFGNVRKGTRLEGVFTVRNSGDGTLEGSVRSLLPFLQVEPQQFICDPGNECAFTVVLDLSQVDTGALHSDQAVQLLTNAGSRTLGLRLNILAPQLRIVSDLLELQVPLGQIATWPLSLRNDGSAALNATIQNGVEWLEVDQHEITIQPGAVETIQVTANAALFSSGQHLEVQDGLRITESNGVQLVPVSITVLQPKLSVDQERIDFGYLERGQTASRQLVLTNEGTGNLAWQAQSGVDWVEVVPSAGFCQAGESNTITLTAYSLAFNQAEKNVSGTLVINSDGGRLKVELQAGTAQPLLATDTPLLELTSINDAPASGSLRIFNHGLGDLAGTISTEQTWLVPERLSFTCPTGRSIEIGVHTDPEELPSGTLHLEGALHIESNGGETTISVSLSMIRQPQLEISTESLVFQLSDKTAWLAAFSLHNSGKQVARVTLAASSEKLQLNRTIFEIKPGKSVPVQAVWNAVEPPAAGEISVDIKSETQSFHITS